MTRSRILNILGDFGLQTQLMAIFVTSALCAISTVYYFSTEFGRLTRATELVSDAGRLRMYSQRVALLTQAAVRNEPGAADQLLQVTHNFDLGIDKLPIDASVVGFLLEDSQLFQVREAWQDLKQVSVAVVSKPHVRPLTDTESPLLTDLATRTLTATEAVVASLVAQTDNVRARVRLFMVSGTVTAAAFVLAMFIYVRRRFLAPLSALGAVLRRIAVGDLAARASVRQSDEIGEVLHSANATAEALQVARAKESESMRQLRDSEIRNRTLWEIAHEAIITIDSDGKIVFANPAVQPTFGYEIGELVGQNISILQPAHLRAAHQAGLTRYVASRSKKVDWQRVELNAVHKDGHQVPVELSFSEMQLSTQTWFVGTFRDITERKRQEAELQHSANFDALTGLANRALLFDRLDQSLHAARRHQRQVGILFLDLDNFKVVNDTLGHERGDELLVEVARRLEHCVRDGDTVARLGGDEFVLLLAEIEDLDDIDAVAHRALSKLKASIRLGESEAYVGASIGACVFPEDGADRTELLRHADIAMYRAKEGGRNNVQRFSAKMQERYNHRMSMETSLRRAIDAGDFVLHYQPQIDILNGAVIGAEALIRWESKELGRVSPAQFIPLAEETGLIVPIGEWVIDRALQDLANLRRTPGLENCRVAINLSARQFAGESLLYDISSAIVRYALPPHLVELEITESLMMTEPERAAKVLEDLRKLGCSVALDDFGTGYSSLAYLRHFPLDCLKIDKSLISDVAILVAVVQLARSFGLKTLAEGVEDEAIVVLLRQIGCDFIQGFFYSRPLPLDQFQDFLFDRKALRLSDQN